LGKRASCKEAVLSDYFSKHSIITEFYIEVNSVCTWFLEQA